ncbi:glycogen debranching enzyme GlgX, partial [Mesorhizobium sp. M4A.F.Ca.ET.029.04.2.1]
MSNLGAKLSFNVLRKGVHFVFASQSATRGWVSVFDPAGATEIQRVELERTPLQFTEDRVLFQGFVQDIKAGARYGFRADGPYAPDKGLWFDPDKLLTDPYAIEIDRPYQYHWRLAAKRNE